MGTTFRLLVLALLLAAVVLYLVAPEGRPPAVVPAAPVAGESAVSAGPDRLVLDISVHTLDELLILLDRAEQLAGSLADRQASVVLILHGPEVEFFASGNYDRYRGVVDRAERLDAMAVVDVKICRTMMQRHGIRRDDIPAFIEQVPDGGAELDRLTRQGYVYF